MAEWLLIDLHIHTAFSDGKIPLEEVIKIYGKAGFDVIAITDHLFDTQSPRSLEIHEEGKSVENLDAYFQKIDGEEKICPDHAIPKYSRAGG
jgi:hypothetical protein